MKSLSLVTQSLPECRTAYSTTSQYTYSSLSGRCAKQTGSISVVLAVIMAVSLCVAGYFLYEQSESASALTQELNGTKRKLRNVQRELRSTASDLEEKQSEVYSANSQRSLLKNEVDSVRTLLDQKKALLDQKELEKQAAMDKLHQELSATKQKLNAIQDERIASTKRLNGEMETLKEQLANTKKEKEATQAALKEEIGSIKTQLANTEKQLTETEKQLANTEENNTQSQAALASAREELEVNRKELETNREELASKLSAKELEYEKQIAQLNEFSAIATQKYETTKQQLDIELARIAEFNAKIETLEERLAREQKALSDLTEQLASLDKTNAELNSEKSRLIKQFKDGTTIIRLEDTILFSSGSASINERGKKTLALVAETLSEFPNHLISIEGHTDHRPIVSRLAKKYPTNWELSAARASFAIRHLMELGLPAKQFQAVGFAHTRPIALDTDYDSQRKNRRIEILLHPPVERVTITPAELMRKNTLTAK